RGWREPNQPLARVRRRFLMRDNPATTPSCPPVPLPMPLAPSHEQEVRRFWAALLGVDEPWLDTDQVVLVPQSFDDEQATIYLFQRGAGVIVSVVAKAPAQALNLAEAALRGRPPAEVLERDLWIEAFTFRCERVNGPS